MREPPPPEFGGPDDDLQGGAPPDAPDLGPPARDGSGPRRPGRPGSGRPRGPRPQFLDGAPDFARHPPPPRTLVFQLSEAQPFPAGWFEPDAHLPK
jgi:hypothetical protein